VKRKVDTKLFGRKYQIKKIAVQKYQTLQIFNINWIKIEPVFCLKILKTQKLEELQFGMAIGPPTRPLKKYHLQYTQAISQSRTL
jgi:hypothetical protein